MILELENFINTLTAGKAPPSENCVGKRGCVRGTLHQNPLAPGSTPAATGLRRGAPCVHTTSAGDLAQEGRRGIGLQGQARPAAATWEKELQISKLLYILLCTFPVHLSPGGRLTRETLYLVGGSIRKN